jgi:hypothetical protein
MNERPSKYDLPYTKFQKMLRAYRRSFPDRGEGRWGATGGSNAASAGREVLARTPTPRRGGLAGVSDRDEGARWAGWESRVGVDRDLRARKSARRYGGMFTGGTPLSDQFPCEVLGILLGTGLRWKEKGLREYP